MLWLALLLAQDEKIVEAYRARVAAQVVALASPKAKLEESLAAAAKLDATVVEELAAKFKSTPDAVRDAWKQRERKPRKISCGDGSWIHLGGQDGGLDSDVKVTPKVERDIADDLIDRNPSVLTKRKKPAAPEPVALGKPIKTRDEWWASASTDERRACVEAAYVRKSAALEKSEETKDCSACKGKGAVNVNRGGIGLAAVCARCHGAKSDLVVAAE